MERIYLSDITMKQKSNDWQNALSFREKIELAKALDRLGVDVIELEGISQKKADSLLIKSISNAVENSVLAVPVSLFPLDVDTVWQALSDAKNPRLQVCAPVSTVQMEYKYHQKPASMLNTILEALNECNKCTNDVEFIAYDATRSDYKFLCEVVEKAIENGAKTVTICDNAGVFLPDELAEFLSKLTSDVPSLSKVRLGVHCSNELAMADACAVSAVRAGVRELKVASYPVDTVSLGNITTLLTRREDVCGVRTSMRTTELKKGLSRIAGMFETQANKVSPLVNGTKDDMEHIVLTFNDDRNSLFRAIKTLGYDLNEDDRNRVWDAFTAIAVHKQSVGARELEAIIASHAMQVPTAYVLEGYVISASSSLGATSHVKLSYNGKQMDGISAGDGPIDASYLAIERCIGSKCELDDFQIRAVTEGREAMGEAITKLRYNGKLYSGRGISTDITEASIEAYINALNKIVYEEDMG